MHQEQGPVAVVIAAMSEELAAVATLLGGVVIDDGPVGGHDRHHLLDVGGRVVALRRSGIGFTNATAAVAHCYHDFGAVPVLSVGTAGGLMRGIAIGDVVVGDHYVNVNADATAFGYALGQVPGMPPRYAPDARMVALATGSDADYRIRPATIGSSEVFVTEGRARLLRDAFPDVAAVDMESAAIAQFAHVHDMPFVSIRGISDLCAPDGDEFKEHLDDAAARSARVAHDVLTGLAA
ncbi:MULTISPECIES: 5'-methylthioadenosine/S-adenosylhomocysteine nucleosidase [unclassified Curtobacterium]|uniref:5'-methylthioadenosine/S-adenosylhomocysteine nucleosidase n=1 Tax=unclassified Curtobacterium TaxID=257496 RepID=UPI0009F52250|nr:MULTISPECIES: 5'-methylthioadenosine/S-adenosylhomocysteine nucleosidase [unclassified Curtobacterium]WIA97530.1 5'-methylthioadenosine/S-adenosylhomocysteine nucleosidase [Curtobacterium sp. MCBA15_004]